MTAIKEYNKTLNLIKQNINNIAYKIDGIEKWTNYLLINSALEEIIIVTNIFLHILTKIENAITFARLKTVHNSISKLTDLEFMLQKLSTHYLTGELFFGNDTSNLIKYYEIMDVESYYSDNKIVFLIHFPIMYPETYSYYHLYPIPNKNNKILLPPKPYLIIGNNDYQYEDNECKNLHPVYYCTEKRVFNEAKQIDCIHEILQLRDSEPTSCKSISAVIPKDIIEQITTAQYIAIFPKETRIELICQKKDITILKGTFFIEVPMNCSFRTSKSFYANFEDSIIGQALFLPELKITVKQMNHIPDLVIQDIPLDKIHELQKEQEKIHLSTLKNIAADSNIFWAIPIYTILIIFFIIAALVAYKIRYILQNAIWKTFRNDIAPTQSITQEANMEEEDE